VNEQLILGQGPEVLFVFLPLALFLVYKLGRNWRLRHPGDKRARALQRTSPGSGRRR